jgi:hypothetical protein
VPHRPVLTGDEQLKAPIGARADNRVVDEAHARVSLVHPLRPGRADPNLFLPEVPEITIGADGEQFEPAVGAERERRSFDKTSGNRAK